MSSRSAIEARHDNEPLVIACGYADGMLASSWFRAYKRVKQTIKRGSFEARVELVPITELPPLVDVLIVPPELEDVARALPAVRELLIAEPGRVQREFDHVVDRLVRDGHLAHAPAPARVLAVHRGFRALAERARLVD
jgi:hypothetical protein